MKRLLVCLSLTCCLLFLSGGASRSADDKPPEKKEEAKAPDLKLDVPSSIDVATGSKATLTVKVDPEGYDGPIKVKLTGLPGESPQEATIDKGSKSTTIDFVIKKKHEKLTLKVDAVGGDLKSSAEVAVGFRDPSPVETKGDAGAIITETGGDAATVPDLGNLKTNEIDRDKPDQGKVIDNLKAQEKGITDNVNYTKKVAEFATKSRFGTNVMWTLLTGFLVMFMMAGFALVETGLTRAKNVAHTMSMNLFIYAIGIVCYYVVGFGLMYGGSGNGSTSTFGGFPFLTSEYSLKFHVPGYDGEKEFGLWGFDGFCLLDHASDISVLVIFLFQFVFMDTAATIPTGAMAERWKFSAFAMFGVFMCAFCYPIYGNWVWGGGWLSTLGSNFNLGHGHVDYAGSSVVHMTGGICALAGIIVLGPRIGKYNKDGSVNVLPAHNIPMVVLGTMILAFGWFGFNPGSSLQLGDNLISGRVAVNTMLASATGMISCTLYMWLVYGKPDPSFMCNGMLAGLVAITAPCAFVTSWAACLIGAVAGILVIWSALFWEKIIKVDDPVGAVSVHGINGMWGVLALGIFADGTFGKAWNGTHLYKDTSGAFHWLADTSLAAKDWIEVGVTGWYYGNSSQFYAEAIGTAANILWVFPTSLLFFGLYGLIIGNRVKKEVELQGLDIHEMGVAGYINEDPKTPEGHISSSPVREPRPALTANGRGRFTVLVDGSDVDAVVQAWSDLCQPSQTPTPPDFLAVYPHMTTLQGNRFTFRDGDPEQVRASLERLLQGRLGVRGLHTEVVR